MPDYSTTLNRANTSNGSVPKMSSVNSFQSQLTLGVPTTVDLRSFQNLNMIHEVQGVFIDNSANAAGCSISTSSGQMIVVPPQSQAVMPLYMSPDMTLTLTGNGTVTFVLLNFPTPAAVWASVATAIPQAGGKALVSDPTLEALISNGAFQASQALYGNADTIVHARAGEMISGLVVLSTTPAVVLSGSPSYFLNAFRLSIAPNIYSTGGIAEYVKFQLTDTGTSKVIAVDYLLLPAAQPTITTATSLHVLEISGINYVATTAGSNLELSVSATVTDTIAYYSLVGGTTGIL